MNLDFGPLPEGQSTANLDHAIQAWLRFKGINMRSGLGPVGHLEAGYDRWTHVYNITVMNGVPDVQEAPPYFSAITRLFSTLDLEYEVQASVHRMGPGPDGSPNQIFWGHPIRVYAVGSLQYRLRKGNKNKPKGKGTGANDSRVKKPSALEALEAIGSNKEADMSRFWQELKKQPIRYRLH